MFAEGRLWNQRGLIARPEIAAQQIHRDDSVIESCGSSSTRAWK
jgi:hypothetical protein